MRISCRKTLTVALKSGAFGPLASSANVRHQYTIHLLNVVPAAGLPYKGRCFTFDSLLIPLIEYIDVKHGARTTRASSGSDSQTRCRFRCALSKFKTDCVVFVDVLWTTTDVNQYALYCVRGRVEHV